MRKHYYHNISGEQKDQLMIVVDKHGNKLGSATRSECHNGEGKTHLAFMAFIILKGKIILTRRSGNKSLWSGFWDASVVSHVLANETVENAAKRRGKEELGVVVNFKDLGAFYYFAKHGKSAENEYCHVLIGATKDKIHPNPVEIEEVKSVKREELAELVKKYPKSFTPWFVLAIDKIKL